MFPFAPRALFVFRAVTSRSILSACSPARSYIKSFYIIIRLANKINRFPAKFRKNFQFRNQGFGTFPKFQNERIGCKAETLIFPVCTDTGCACYSLKSYTRISNALSFPEKPRARFLLKSSRTGGQTLKKCPLYGERKNKKSVGITPPMG